VSAQYFASDLLAELRKRDPRAVALRANGRGQTCVIGIEDDGEFVPLLKLTGASAKFNVMSLLVYHHGRWQPTLKRGTPEELAMPLTGELQHLWTIPVEMAKIDFGQASDHPSRPTEAAPLPPRRR
jgi:hypothetical protein